MITELTKEQTDRFPEFVDRWTKIGLSCEPLDDEKVKAAIHKLYACGGINPPKEIKIVDSPYAGVIMATMLRKGIKDEEKIKKTTEEMLNCLFQQKKPMKDALKELNGVIFGNQSVSWLSFYSYMREVVGLVKETDSLAGLFEVAETCGWVFPYDTIAIVCRRPVEINLRADGQLHKDGGMAIKYPDGWGIYYMNGVSVPKWLAETPKEDIDPNKLIKISNVQVRAEFVKKVGVLPLFLKLPNKIIDEDIKNQYWLRSLEINDRNYCALQMVNPSTGEDHIEFVTNDCQTVQDAIAFRNQRAFAGKTISEDGEDWYQQGDTIQVPRGAKSLKPRPIILT